MSPMKPIPVWRSAESSSGVSNLDGPELALRRLFGIAGMDISIAARVSCALICVTAPMQRCPRAPAPYARNLQNSRWGQRLGPISAPHGLIGRYAKQNVRDDQCARRSVLAIGRTCPRARHLIVAIAIAFVRRMVDARLGPSRRKSVDPCWPGLMFQRHKMKNFGTNCDRENSFRVGRV
jgi:hypothetical protein